MGMPDRKVQKRARNKIVLLLLLLAAVLGLCIFSVTFVRVYSPNGDACWEATRTETKAISTAIDVFQAVKKRLPESLDELTVETADSAALLNKSSLNDSWGNPFRYKKIDKYKYEIRSAGPDGKMDTADDLTN